MRAIPNAEPVSGSPGFNARLICFEGLDGAGKTTTASLLAQALAARGEPCEFLEKKAYDLDDPALADRMARLKRLIWDYGEAPIANLGDHHSLYIMASWFAAFDRAMVAPRLARGISVVVDNWYHKFVARFERKPGFDLAHVERCFAELTPVDEVVFLDIDPAVAAARKGAFTQAEVGGLDGGTARSADAFVGYQSSVRERLLARAQQKGWISIPAGAADPSTLAQHIAARLGERRAPRNATDLKARLDPLPPTGERHDANHPQPAHV
jgi:dTMP kinase